MLKEKVMSVSYTHLNPATDDQIYTHFTAEDPSGKAENKRRLQERLGLAQDPAAPLIGRCV